MTKLMTKLLLASTLALFCSAYAQAQGPNASSSLNYYWVTFTDKTGTPYSIDAPEAFLSPRAIQKRERLNIEVTAADFPPNPAYLEGLKAQGARVHHRSRWLNAATVACDSATAAALLALDYVQTVNYVGKYSGQKGPGVKPLKGMAKLGSEIKPDEYYGYGAQQIKLINGDSLHQMGFDGSGVLVAVLDGGFTGVDQSPFFDSLRANEQLLPAVDIVDMDDVAWESSSHGTKVLSCMGANRPGLLVGTAPGATYICIKTEETRSETLTEECHWVAGIEYADSLGADVVNSSLGYTQFDENEMNYTLTDLNGRKSVASQAADIAASKGMLVVTSAGNEGSSAWRGLGVPADAAGALSIGATTLDGRRASFSSYGPTADRRIKPDVSAPGAWVTLADARNYQVTMGSGTSFASPITAGMVACLRQAFPTASVEEIYDAVRNSSSQADVPDASIGYGIPDFVKAYHLLKEADKPRP